MASASIRFFEFNDEKSSKFWEINAVVRALACARLNGV